MPSLARPLVALAAAALVAAACSGGPAASAGPSAAAAFCENSTAAGEVAVAIKDFVYDPEPVQVKVGQVVTWTNQDSAPHTATFSGTACATATLKQGEAGAIKFTAPGTYEYFCVVHPAQMKAKVVVAG